MCGTQKRRSHSAFSQVYIGRRTCSSSYLAIARASTSVPITPLSKLSLHVHHVPLYKPIPVPGFKSLTIRPREEGGNEHPCWRGFAVRVRRRGRCFSTSVAGTSLNRGHCLCRRNGLHIVRVCRAPHVLGDCMLTITARYDQGVMSALLTAKQFEDVFPQVITGHGQPANHATLQSFVVAIYVSILPLRPW